MFNVEFNIFSLSGLLILCTFPILTILSLKNYKSELHGIWAIFNIAVGIWGFGALLVSISKDKESAFLYWKLAHVGIIFIPILYFHVSVVFCNLLNKKILFLLYVIFSLFLLSNISNMLFQKNLRFVFSSFYYIKPTILYYVFFCIWALIALAGILNYVFSYYRFTGIKKIQIKYFIFATIFGFSGGLMNFLPVFHIDIFPYGNLLVPLFPIVVTYAILRYRLMDINLIIKKGMVYSISAGILTSFFVVLVITMTKFLSDEAGIASFTITIIAALIIAVLFNPLKNRIQLLIDKTFYKRTYDYYTTIQKVSRELASMFEINKIFSFIGNIIFSTLGLSNIYILSADSGADYKVVYHMSYKGEKKDGKTRNEKVMLERDGDNKHVPRFNINPDFINILRHSDDVVIKDELPGVVEIFGKETIERIEKTMESYNGEVIVPVFVDNKLSVLMMLGEKLSGDIFTREDINLLVTISNQTAVALKNARLYAEKLGADRFASMGLMSATFAHEIRNPLTSIKTFAQLLPEKYKDDEFREVFSKVVIDDIERINRLIKDLLSFSDEKSLTFKENFDVISLMDGVLNNLKTKLNLEDRKIYVEKIYKSVKIILSGDSKKLKQAFINIITNACQAIGESGTLKITITPNGKYVDIMINDTGSGISQEDIEKIFDPFYTTSPMGMGLGLAISKKIIEDHGGMVTVDSEIEQGSTFTVSLPAQN
jgi:signal transduction histidine kinase